MVMAMAMAMAGWLDLLAWIGTAARDGTRAGLTFPVSRVARHLKQVRRIPPQAAGAASDRNSLQAFAFRTIDQL